MKGFRDFYPEEKRKEEYVFSIWKKVVERYGYEEIDVPILESVEVYSKSGQEIPEQIYRFKDKSGREVALRPETTPSIARMIRAKGNLKKPIKWFSISQCYRYERQQRGRSKEFFQLNVDYLGSRSMQADAEVIVTLIKILNEFKLSEKDFFVRISNRRLMEDLFKSLKIKNIEEVSRVLDKKDKVNEKEIKKELKKLKLEDKQIKGLFKIFKIKSLNKIKIESTGLGELKELFSILKKYKVEKYCELDLSVMRGFEYYTGTVFEAFDKKNKFRAIAGGGRYDNLAGMPGVGYGMGDVVLGLVVKDKIPELKSKTRILIIPINTFDECLEVGEKLRKEGLNVEIDLLGRNISKNLDYANKKEIPYVIIIGENELKKNKVKLKEMKSGKEKLVKLEKIKKII